MDVSPSEIAGIPLFCNFSLSELAQVLELAEKVVIRDGEVLFEEGDPADAFYILLEGQISIEKDLDEDGRRESLVILKPSEMFGEMALLDDEPRSASAISSGPSVLLRISRDLFDTRIGESNLAAYKLMYNVSRVLCGRIRRTDHRLMALLRSRTPTTTPQEASTAPAEPHDELVELGKKLFSDWCI